MPETNRRDVQAQTGAVPHYVTEWNTMVGRGDMPGVTDPAWPCNNYPPGLLRSVLDYLVPHDGLLGFAVFVDTDPAGGSPAWSASAARGHLNSGTLDQLQCGTLQAWDADMDEVFANGW